MLFIGLLVLAALQFRVPALAHYGLLSLLVDDEVRGSQSVLRHHQLQIDAKPIPGIDRNLSGLTFSHHTQTLFGVINRPASVVEISTDGVLLRTVPLRGFKDPEGITHVRDHWFVVSDERDNRLHWVYLDEDARQIDAAQTFSIQLPLLPRPNLGIEGLSWDAVHGRLVVVQEQWPQRVWMLSGLESAHEGRLNRLDVAPWRRARWLDVVTADLSSVTVHEPSGQWFFLSAASGLVVQHTADGRLVDTFPLWQGFRGLTQTIPQAEGMAFDPAGRLFIVSEPNLFYRFGPP